MPAVLIVENDPLVASLLEFVLEGAGHNVVGTAKRFDRAVELAEATRPDLALVDYRLDCGIDGVVVARHLRRLGVKVIYVTGDAQEVRLVDGLAVIVAKPCTPEALLSAVKTVIASAQSHKD